MNELIKTKDQEELVMAIRNRAMTDSIKIASLFHKQHKNVLRAIENLDCSDKFNRLNFHPVKPQPTAGTVTQLKR